MWCSFESTSSSMYLGRALEAWSQSIFRCPGITIYRIAKQPLNNFQDRKSVYIFRDWLNWNTTGDLKNIYFKMAERAKEFRLIWNHLELLCKVFPPFLIQNVCFLPKLYMRSRHCKIVYYLVRLNYLVLPRVRVWVSSVVVSIIQFALFVYQKIHHSSCRFIITLP